MTEVVVSFFVVAACKFVGEDFGSDSVDTDCEVMVCDGSVSGFDAPEGFRESVDSCRGIEDDFCSVKAESHPMKGMVSSVTDVDSDFAELSHKDGMPWLTFHVVGRLVEIADSRDVSFDLFAQNGSVVIDDNSCIVDCSLMGLSFEDGWDDDNIVLLCQFLQELTWLTIDWFREFYPGVLFSSAEEEGSCPNLLQTDDIDTFKSS